MTERLESSITLFKGVTRGGLKGAEATPLAKSKLRIRKEVLIFSRFHAYNLIKMLLQHYYYLPVI